MNKRKSSPLVPGGNNFTAMHLVFLPWAIRVKMSLWCYFFALLIGMPGLFFPVLSCMMFRFQKFDQWEDWAMLLLFFISGGVFLWSAIRMVVKIRKRCRSFFDLSARLFYPEGKKGKAIFFSEFDSLQIITERCHTNKRSFDSFELNLVLKNGSRYNLLDHSNKECLIEEAEMLAGKLSLPLTDAEGKRLNADTFLDLSGGIRTNLLFGILLIAGSVIIFAFFNGRAYLMTQKSLRWERTPALVENVQIRKHSGKHTRYSLALRYSYSFKGKNFSSSCYRFFSSTNSSRFAVEQIARRYPAGKKISCYVDPQTPANAVINRHIPDIWELLGDSTFSLALLTIGILLLINAARKKYFLDKRSRRSRGTVR